MPSYLLEAKDEGTEAITGPCTLQTGEGESLSRLPPPIHCSLNTSASSNGCVSLLFLGATQFIKHSYENTQTPSYGKVRDTEASESFIRYLIVPLSRLVNI